jgi:hypothetical protein
VSKGPKITPSSFRTEAWGRETVILLSSRVPSIFPIRIQLILEELLVAGVHEL